MCENTQLKVTFKFFTLVLRVESLSTINQNGDQEIKKASCVAPGAVADFIDKVLDEDRRAPRKQRHTARRIHRRILSEFPDTTVAESTVRNHVRERKRQMGLERCETFVPQSYSWAQEAQVDWYEAWVDLGDERTKGFCCKVHFLAVFATI
jgi:hypothetical protein